MSDEPTSYLVAENRYKTDQVHVPAEEDPTRPRCTTDGDKGRFPDASFETVDADDPVVEEKDLCKLCDPDYEVPRESTGRAMEAKLSAMSVDDVPAFSSTGDDPAGGEAT